MRREQSIVQASALALALTACASADPAPGDVFETAPHPPYPALTRHGGTVLEHVELVTVTYPDDARRGDIEAFGDFILTSSWWAATAAEYGVGAGSQVATFTVPTPPPAEMTDDDLRDLLTGYVRAGTLPASHAPEHEVVYLFYISRGTTFRDGGTLCASYYGYHDVVWVDGEPLVYGVVGDCDGFDDLTATAAHELVEAATNPVDGYDVDLPKRDPWTLFDGLEDADLCQYLPYVYERGWGLQRSWSKASADAGRSPCAPVPEGEIDFNVSAAPAMPTVRAGGSAVFTLTGWSNAPVPDWSLSTYGASYDFEPLATFDHDAKLNNGDETTLRLEVPAHAKSGQIGGVIVYSDPEFIRFWPVGVVVE